MYCVFIADQFVSQRAHPAAILQAESSGFEPSGIHPSGLCPSDILPSDIHPSDIELSVIEPRSVSRFARCVDAILSGSVAATAGPPCLSDAGRRNGGLGAARNRRGRRMDIVINSSLRADASAAGPAQTNGAPAAFRLKRTPKSNLNLCQ